MDVNLLSCHIAYGIVFNVTDKRNKKNKIFPLDGSRRCNCSNDIVLF